MNDKVSVSSPVEVVDHSPERVALDLMTLISRHETVEHEQRGDRHYWLTLYRQCWKAVNGHPLESTLKED